MPFYTSASRTCWHEQNTGFTLLEVCMYKLEPDQYCPHVIAFTSVHSHHDNYMYDIMFDVCIMNCTHRSIYIYKRHLSVCLSSVVCSVPAFYPAMRRWPRATLMHAREHAQSWCMIYVDTWHCTPARAHVQLQCHNYGSCWLRSRSNCSESPSVCRSSTWAVPSSRMSTGAKVHTSKHSNYYIYKDYNHADCAISTANHFDQWGKQSVAVSLPDFFVEWIWWRIINIFLKSCSRSEKLQPGGKPNSFAFRNPGRPRRSINCSRDGSRTASPFAIQVNPARRSK